MYKYLRFNRQMIFLISLSFIFISHSSFSQNAIKGLVVSEVYFEKSDPRKNWIEIYNPTNEELILERFRLSHIRAINILPLDDRNKDGIKIKAKNHLVICADQERFNSEWRGNIKIIEVKMLSKLPEGGFAFTSTRNCPEEKTAGFRFGNPKHSFKIENLLGKQVLQITDKRKSYSRKIIKSENGIEITEFIETSQTPGNIN